MWQSPSCSTCLDLIVPVTVRHGLPGSRTVCCPGRCRPCSGLEGQLPCGGAGGGGGGGGAAGFAGFFALQGAVAPGGEGRAAGGELGAARRAGEGGVGGRRG